jgi:hypothetical protein
MGRESPNQTRMDRKNTSPFCVVTPYRGEGGNCCLSLDSRDPVVYNRRMVLGGGQAAGGAPLRPAASVIGAGMEDIL